jgi:hypothetical protein
MTTALVPSTPTATTTALTKKELAQSALYPNIKTPAQAAVVMQKARSYGLCPTTIADGLFFVGGKPALSAQLIATLLKRSGKYDYRIKTKTDKECSIEFFELRDGKRESLGVETFTMAMATRAALASGVNWKKFPEAMLWARCLTAGVRARCPDALGGNPVYSVEELSPSTEVDAEGRPIIEAEVVAAPVAGLVELRELLAKTGADLTRFLAHYCVSSLEEMSADDVQDAIGNLRERLK